MSILSSEATDLLMVITEKTKIAPETGQKPPNALRELINAGLVGMQVGYDEKTGSIGAYYVIVPAEPGANANEKTITISSELERRFTYHAPKGDQPTRYEQIRATAKSFAYLIDHLCPNSREKSLAWTALEEASMWANAAIARNEE